MVGISPGFLLLFVLIFCIGGGGLSYYLGLRKTQTPKVAGFLGMVVSIFPPFGLLYLIVLVLKNDINPTSSVNE